MESITLKDDLIFLVSDRAGEITNGPEGFGLYLQDTRYLSRLELRINGEKPQLLSQTADYNLAATFRLSANYQVQLDEQDSTIAPAWTLAAHAVGIARRRFVKGGMVENLEITNFHAQPVKVILELQLGADFLDIFEVRGFQREKNSHAVGTTVLCEGQVVNFHSEPLEGHSGTTRNLRLECNRSPLGYSQKTIKNTLNGLELAEVTLTFEFELEPHQSQSLSLQFLPDPLEPLDENICDLVQIKSPVNFATEVSAMRQVYTDWQNICTRLKTSDYGLAKLFETSTLDLRTLMQKHRQGLMVTAGIPWYFTLFGRDSLITGIETLSLNPQIAVDTLRVLAAYQATEFDDWRDSEPGKILHELRLGDMTLSGEVPHGPYYGSVDSTLLFILCFTETLKWLDDPAFFAELWPNIERALQWAEEYGDIDGDGYIEFKRRSRKGILHQGWKDSDESMGGSLGPRPSLPLALVEVQGYYYAALTGLTETLQRYGNPAQIKLSERLEAKAASLKEKFNREFWWPEEKFFAQALDGQKSQVRNITSNPGHCLWSGIIDDDKAAGLVARLMQSDMLCGWGIRTMSATDPTYNPMSYHNGSIWPHDNALILAGLRRYGFHNETQKVAGELLAAAATFPDYRLPELYCGFARNEAGNMEHAPAAYPVSCSPQAWAAGATALILQTLLGIQADARNKTLVVEPLLPDGIDDLILLGLRMGNSRVSLSFWRDPVSNQIDLDSTQHSTIDLNQITIKRKE